MKKWLAAILVLMMFAVLAACGAEEEATDSQTADAQTTETVKVTHELGETEVPKNPEKVVVFDFGILDTLDQLGVEAVAGVAQGNIPTYLEQYEDTEKYENIGTLKEADFEAIHAMDPDLIIISGRQAEMYNEFSDIAPTIHLGVDTTDYMNSFTTNMETVGEIFGKEAEVKEELAAINEQIEGIKEKTASSEEKGLIVLANEGKVSAYGAASRFGIIHDVFGVKQADEGIEASTHGQSITYEYILDTNPDMMFVVDRNAAVGNDASAKDSLENELVQKTNAYQNDKIIYLDPDYWYLSGGGLQSVSEMVNAIESAF
ncbi:siderophore ABC transporter substrate-binding protein [Planococcus sp. CP5-4]|uniref:siderophore ABC transporter substrate-binding protein n=1 Tax=unclassified Planococcus (in: firmicutes) TaxID=2662419 RepID=UPI001C2312C0|nr:MULTISPECIES: siderophore ABC transporter substrate-binding protein [unclassified Planococcus (in: firmicutes)]MBU9672400.1 siderophore ABC transporter substrate-binding protein [Planococcus sp. CP5-4_YE]MBV0909451.1 siderophore ABC transporter substrate-binding protein [Planococcus sp. CP5-4_UN]MBW6064180.1 siderophore ABC transporter substrate-binding protein [Planococcus sp. CP5-4]